jgi:hypothetical protein
MQHMEVSDAVRHIYIYDIYIYIYDIRRQRVNVHYSPPMNPVNTGTDSERILIHLPF